MTQDFAKKRRPRPTRPAPKSNVPGWVWLFTGTVLGAFIMFLAYLSGLTSSHTTSKNKPLPTSAVNAGDQPETGKGDSLPKPRFDFYQLLKESEVVVTRPSTEGAAKTIPPPDANATTEFILQVGSFKSPQDADRLRAELLLLNLHTRVETVTVRNGEIWHRVLVGPFTSSASLSKARNTLSNNNIDTLLLKRKTKS